MSAAAKKRHRGLFVGLMAIGLIGSLQKIVRAEKGLTLYHHTLPTGYVQGADISPDGRYIAVERQQPPVEVDKTSIRVREEVEIWEIGTERLISTKTLIDRTLRFYGGNFPDNAEEHYVRYSNDGAILVVYDGGKSIHILQLPNLAEIRTIQLNLPAAPRQSGVVDVELAPNSHIGAVVLTRGQDFLGGAVVLYDFDKGTPIREWKFGSGLDFSGTRVAFGPDGKRLAMTVLPVNPGIELPKRAHNLRVMDTQSGQEVLAINTGYVAGPIAYKGNEIFTASLDPPRRTNRHDPPIKVFDANTGKLLREITNSGTGVRYQMTVATATDVLMGYIGVEKITRDDGEEYIKVVNQRFGLWNLRTGTVFATSPDIVPVELERPEIRLGSDGRLVLIFWSNGANVPIVFEVK